MARSVAPCDRSAERPWRLILGAAGVHSPIADPREVALGLALALQTKRPTHVHVNAVLNQVCDVHQSAHQQAHIVNPAHVRTASESGPKHVTLVMDGGLHQEVEGSLNPFGRR